MSGKRKKYTPEERQHLAAEEARKRNQYESHNLGRYTKIFILCQEQFNDYKKFYDYALELFNTSQKVQANGSVMFNKQVSKEIPSYNNYFEPKVHKERAKKQEKQNIKNNSRIGKEHKDQDAVTRAGQTQMSFSSSATNKRANSAKSRPDKKEKRVVYDRVSSKKSLKN